MPGMFIFSGEGAGEAIGISIFSGEVEGFGDGAGVDEGICMPGMFICSGDAPGRADGVCEGTPDMPGMFMSIFSAGAFFDREEARDVEGMFMPFIFIPLPPPLFCVCFLLATVNLDLDLGLLLGLLPIFMPGIFCMSCCAWTDKAVAPRNKPVMAIAQNFKRKIDLKLFIIPSRMIPASRKVS